MYVATINDYVVMVIEAISNRFLSQLKETP